MKENFLIRFEKLTNNDLEWICDPFSYGIFKTNLPLNEKEQLIDISSDKMLEKNFKTTTYQEFWISIGEEYKALKTKAINILIQFFSTYLCEAGFSKCVTLKTKHRARLNPEDDLRLAISKITPEIKAIMDTLQPQTSH